MIYSRKLLQFVEYVTTPVQEPVVIYPTDTIELLHEEIQQSVEAVSVMHLDSDDYTTSAKNILVMCEATEKLEKAIADRRKVELQIAEINQKHTIDWGELVPVIVRIVMYAGITCVILCLERQTPLSTRWLKATETLLAPRG